MSPAERHPHAGAVVALAIAGAACSPSITLPSPNGRGRVSHQAWIETLPEASRPVPLAVSPGDSVTVLIARQNGDNWIASLTNNSTKKNYQENVQYASSLSSAEWIQEAPRAAHQND